VDPPKIMLQLDLTVYANQAKYLLLSDFLDICVESLLCTGLRPIPLMSFGCLLLVIHIAECWKQALTSSAERKSYAQPAECVAGLANPQSLSGGSATSCLPSSPGSGLAATTCIQWIC
jgi:hypothetical protein